METTTLDLLQRDAERKRLERDLARVRRQVATAAKAVQAAEQRQEAAIHAQNSIERQLRELTRL